MFSLDFIRSPLGRRYRLGTQSSNRRPLGRRFRLGTQSSNRRPLGRRFQYQARLQSELLTSAA